MTKVMYQPTQLQRIRDVQVGKDVVIRDFVNLYDCTIGDKTSIGPFVEIQRNASIGNLCKIASHAFICEDVIIEDGVFIGHGVLIVTESRTNPKAGRKVPPTRIKRGASIGSGAVILFGAVIGEWSVVGAGAVVVDDVPDEAIVVGNPARVISQGD